MDGIVHINDIQEKKVGAVKAPTFPTPNSSAAGFPGPKKRTRFASAFKQQRQAEARGSHATSSPTAKTTATTATTSASHHGTATKPSQGLDEKASIDRENRDRLRNMDAATIERERQELFSSLDPALLQILLRRANLDDGSNDKELPAPVLERTPSPPPEIRVSDADAPEEKKEQSQKQEDFVPETKEATLEHKEKEQTTESAPKPRKLVSFVEDELPDEFSHVKHDSNDHIITVDPEGPPPTLPKDLAPITQPDHHDQSHDHDHDHDHPSSSSMHFPQAPNVPDLDPADPNFLANLHAKYFPNLPADPARLAWMAPLPTADSPADRESPYYPGQATVAVSQLRFDFRGRMVAPRRSRSIPVSKGLHHHGAAPEAAGYTIGELARLARSAVPSQRCVAFQTLGRILFRLGRGDWGAPAMKDDAKRELSRGIWRCVQEGRVLETLHEAAGVEEGRGHRGSRAYAIEAIWLFEKGGWKTQWQGL